MARFGSLQFSDLGAIGPGTPAGRYLHLLWHPVIRARDLAPGRARPIEFLGEKFTLYRGECGTPHVTTFRFVHRGTQLSFGWVEGDSFRCYYHGWRFDGVGYCVEQPNEDRPSATVSSCATTRPRNTPADLRLVRQRRRASLAVLP